MIKAMSHEECMNLLRQKRLAHLGCIYNGKPYVVPVNFVIDDNRAYIHTLPGKKAKAIRSNPKGCLQVEDILSETLWSSVIASGEFEEVPSGAEKAKYLNQIMNSFPSLTPVESMLVQDGIALPVLVYRLTITELTGVSEGL
jgi:uncharacterized protein